MIYIRLLIRGKARTESVYPATTHNPYCMCLNGDFSLFLIIGYPKEAHFSPVCQVALRQLYHRRSSGATENSLVDNQ